MSNLTVSEILEKLEQACVSDEEPLKIGETSGHAQAERQLNELIREARIEGRILELQNVNFVLPPSPELFKYTKKRMAELRKTL